VDITLLQASVLHLPSSKRASAIVYDGTQDLGLWRPPNPDRDLWDAYGEELRNVLDKERKRLPDGELEQGGLLRLHPGKLHCDFLIWVAGRPPHGETSASPAPGVDVVEDITRRVIEFVAQQDVVRVAFPALGAGRGEAAVPDRMAAIVRAVAAYKEACFAAERPTHIEEVIVCDASSANVAKAKRMVEKLARTGYVEPPPAPAAPARASSASSGSSSRKPAASKGESGARRKGVKLRPEDIANARARSHPYDRSRHYLEGEFFIHPTFGVGQVQLVKPERMVVVLFENGEERTMIHSR
jgi:O-acetyl-ADP-ribose deacetylase (regulator of RNase III)